MSDIVFIEQLEVQAILGILPEERTTPSVLSSTCS